jgi:hypothetical protein
MNSLRRELVADRLKETGRQCGSCSLCCFVFAIKELDKPAKRWCRHCKPGKGCSIHGNHPDVCQTFVCEWLIRPVPDHWYPLKSRMVITFPELRDVSPISVLLITVDPRYPSRWREEPYHSDIRGFSQSGLLGTNPGKLYYQTQVRCGDDEWLILPDEVVDATDPRFIRTNGTLLQAKL